MGDLCGNIVKQVLPDSGLLRKTSQANLLMLLDTILMGVVVVVGAYAPRYRRHPVIGGLFLAAATLFLPIVSIIVTIVEGVHGLIHALRDQVINCEDDKWGHLLLVFLWIGVVVVIGINASAVVAGDVREGRNIGPPKILLVMVIWTAYLTFSAEGLSFTFIIPLYVIMFAKLGFKYAAFYKARRSLALGRNPRLVAGYMAQLQQQQQLVVVHAHDDTDTRAPPPALIVMGEDKVQVKQQPHGYNLKKMPNDDQQGDRMTRADSRLVTLDRVWRFQFGGSMDDEAQRQPKDLCFSFALFKLLRCRFAKYTVSEAGFIKTSKFFRKALIQDDDHYRRVFRIITDELSFINDYYYSSLPIHYSHPLLPALGLMLSLCSIGNCVYFVVILVGFLTAGAGEFEQISCSWTTACDGADGNPYIEVGSLYYDAVPLCLVVAVLLLAEMREIVSYVFSNWTKVALIYHHVNRDWWQRPRVVQKCIFALVKYHRCKLVSNWENKMKQCSILVLRPRKTPLRRLRHLLRFVGGQKKVKVPNAVKTAIFEAIKGESFFITTEQDREPWFLRPPSSPIPAVYLHACNNGKHRAAYSILVWNTATSVFEASQLPQTSDSDHNKTVSTHLSRYCTYLVTSRPELLPDDAEWCRKLYDEVKKDADHVLAKVQGVDDHNQLIQALTADSNHEVLRNGARLGKELAEGYSAMGWERLARFWVEMILYVAPSENLEAHAEAISHGGELVTLLWAMLAHAGITGRIDAEDIVAATDDQPA